MEEVTGVVGVVDLGLFSGVEKGSEGGYERLERNAHNVSR